MKRLIWILALAAVLALKLTAQDTEPESPIDESQLTFNFEDTTQAEDAEEVAIPALGFRDFVRMFLFLGVVIGVILLFFWLLRRLTGRSDNPQDIVNVLATQALRNDQVLYLVEVGEQVMLLGGGSGNLSLITEIENQETLDMLRLKASQEQAGRGNSFSQFLNGMLKVPKKDNSSNDINLSSLDDKKKRLRDL